MLIPNKKETSEQKLKETVKVMSTPLMSNPWGQKLNYIMDFIVYFLIVAFKHMI